MWGVLAFWLARLGLGLPARPQVTLLGALPSDRDEARPLPEIGGTSRRISALHPGARQRLADAAPDVLFTDPEALDWLLGGPVPDRLAPRLVLTSALHFSPAARRELASRLPVPVVNYYSTTETGPIAWECPGGDDAPGWFHVLVPDVWVEAERGELLVTRLRPGALPLLRLATSDAGEVSLDPCPRCGHPGPSIVGFQGRSACRFLAPDGRELDAWRLAPTLRRHSLRAFQLRQEGPNELRLLVRPIAGGELPGPALEADLRRALGLLGWPAPLLRVEAAPAGLGDGKVQPFVRLG